MIFFPFQFQMILLFAIAMFFANTIFPAGMLYLLIIYFLMSIIFFNCSVIILSFYFIEYSTSTCLSIFFWGAMIFVTMSTIIYYGSEFVDYPKLCPLEVKRMNYYEKSQI